MSDVLSDLQIAAALAELIYRRSLEDQPIDLTDIGIEHPTDLRSIKVPSSKRFWEVLGSEWNSSARRICCNSKNLRGARWLGSAAIFCPISPCT
jgi:hypothetical protein